MTQHNVAAASDGDLPPGVDGGSTDAEVPFFFRRQPVFYRSAHPVGSIIVDKQQHFLYLIQPKQVALRYGIGVGKSCAGVAGLHNDDAVDLYNRVAAGARVIFTD